MEYQIGDDYANELYILFLFSFFSFSYLRRSLLPQNYSCLHIPENITVSAMFFLPYVAIITAAAFKKDCSYINKFVIRSHDGDLEHSLMKEKNIDLHMFFFPFLCSVIPDSDLRILQMLIRKCFRDALQPAVY